MAINELKGQKEKLENFQKEEIEDLKKLVENEKERMRDKANNQKIQVFKKPCLVYNRHCCKEYTRQGCSLALF